MNRRSLNGVVVSILAVLLLVGALMTAQTPVVIPESRADDRMSPGAYWIVDVQKTAGKEMTDKAWAHNHHSEPEAHSVSLAVSIYHPDFQGTKEFLTTMPPNFQMRYLVHGQPVSDWITTPPFAYTLSVDNPRLPALDGIHDLSVEVQTPPGVPDVRPRPMQLHLHRGRAVDPTVPIMNRDNLVLDLGKGVAYTRACDRPIIGHPADPQVEPWTTPPNSNGLYLVNLVPTTPLFGDSQLCWEEPPGTPSAGLPFVRGVEPDRGEDLRQLYSSGLPQTEFGNAGNRGLPFKDGPRGVGWTDGYVQGQVDKLGGYAHVNIGGPLRYLMPNGELITVAGWRVRPNKHPVWHLKPLASIRQNMELRGTWIDGQDAADPGFHAPGDVTIDWSSDTPTSATWYVAGGADHVIWKVLVDKTTWTGRVSVFAGSTARTAGYVDGAGTAARFFWPQSLVHDPVCQCLYVADMQNDAVRKVTMGGVVTTVFGKPGMGARLKAAGARTTLTENGVVQSYDQRENRTLSRFTVTGAPDIYLPFVIRVDSTGNINLLELGYGSIRAINPTTGAATLIQNVDQKFKSSDWGWAAMDTDRWGKSGPLDSIYWSRSVGDTADGLPGARFNEQHAWVSKDGTSKQWLFAQQRDHYGQGQGFWWEAEPPHYAWAMAVDPRGGLRLAGFGNQGIGQLRMVRPGDPRLPPADLMADGEKLWRKGWLAPWQAVSISTPLPNFPAVSYIFQYGWQAHNYLGFPDAWDITPTMSDAEIVEMFGISPEIQANPAALKAILAFLRFYGAR